MEQLKEYLRGHVKVGYELREENLLVGTSAISYDFLEKVNELKPIKFVLGRGDKTEIAFSTLGIGDKSEIIASGLDRKVFSEN